MSIAPPDPEEATSSSERFSNGSGERTRNPGMTFIYVSGAGTDSSEHGRSMWASVKGQTENAILRLPFKGAYMFRPGVIEPLYGAKSKTASVRVFYSLTKPMLAMLRRLFPSYILTTEQIGRVMLEVARHGAPKHVKRSRSRALSWNSATPTAGIGSRWVRGNSSTPGRLRAPPITARWGLGSLRPKSTNWASCYRLRRCAFAKSIEMEDLFQQL